MSQESFEFDFRLAGEILGYAKKLVGRGWVCNTLGTVAARRSHLPRRREHIYTKRKGVSLEEMEMDDVCVTDLDDTLLYGEPPSIGHQLNRAVFRERKDIGAVIHLHVDEVIAYFTATQCEKFRFISDDVPFVLEKWPYILAAHINVENDVDLVPTFIHDTNLFVMPNHGVTSLGETIPQAYHRLTSFVAEVRRISQALILSQADGVQFEYLDDDEVKKMFLNGPKTIYGRPLP